MSLVVLYLVLNVASARPLEDAELNSDGSHHVPIIQYDNADIVPPGESPLKNLDKVQDNRQYVDFINELYRFDKTKDPLKFDANKKVTTTTIDLTPEYNPDYYEGSHSRRKRTLIFRPLFVYREQQVRRERVKAEVTTTQTPKRSIPANKSQLYKDRKNKVYKEHNSFYDPYRYGQRFPYRQY